MGVRSPIILRPCKYGGKDKSLFQNRQICLNIYSGQLRNSSVKYTRHPNGLKAFGQHLRSIRKAKGLSQEGLAWKADLELSQISRMERGILNTSLSQLIVIAEALDIHPKELLDFEIPDKREF